VDELFERILSDAFWDAGPIFHTVVCPESRIDISVLAGLTSSQYRSGYSDENLSTLYTLSFSSHSRMAVSIGTMLHFPIFSSLEHERNSVFLSIQSFQTIQHAKLMHFAMCLLIIFSWLAGASPLCRSHPSGKSGKKLTGSISTWCA
jgi:hypothetical protein